MTTSMRMIDEEVARAAYEAHKAKCSELSSAGQRLLARILPTSKYFGQGAEGALFSVAIAPDVSGYVVVGGPGGKYRLSDVDLFAMFSDDVEPIQITKVARV